MRQMVALSPRANAFANASARRPGQARQAKQRRARCDAKTTRNRSRRRLMGLTFLACSMPVQLFLARAVQRTARANWTRLDRSLKQAHFAPGLWT